MSTTFVGSKININNSTLEDIHGLPKDEESKISITSSNGKLLENIPPSISTLLEQILNAINENGHVAVSTLPEVLSSNAAAELLGISRPTLMKRVENGEIPFLQVGTHRRFNRKDVLKYRQMILEKQEKKLEELRNFYANEGNLLHD